LGADDVDVVGAAEQLVDQLRFWFNGEAGTGQKTSFELVGESMGGSVVMELLAEISAGKWNLDQMRRPACRR
jgi:hypothetical protein